MKRGRKPIAIHHEEALRYYRTAEGFARYTGVPLRLARQAVEAWRDLQAARAGRTVDTTKRARSCWVRLKNALTQIDRDVAAAAKWEAEEAALDEAVRVWVHGRKQAAVLTPDEPPAVRPQRCKHPRASRKFVGFGTKCELCGGMV